MKERFKNELIDFFKFTFNVFIKYNFGIFVVIYIVLFKYEPTSYDDAVHMCKLLVGGFATYICSCIFTVIFTYHFRLLKSIFIDIVDAWKRGRDELC